jgi:hypothetical protein
MVKDVFIFLIVFLVCVIAFSLAFHMLVGHKAIGFSSWGNSMYVIASEIPN